MKKKLLIALSAILLLSSGLMDSVLSKQTEEEHSINLLMASHRDSQFELYERLLSMLTKLGLLSTPEKMYNDLHKKSLRDDAIDDLLRSEFSSMPIELWIEFDFALAQTKKWNLNAISYLAKKKIKIDMTKKVSAEITSKLLATKNSLEDYLNEEIKKSQIKKQQREKLQEQTLGAKTCSVHKKTSSLFRSTNLTPVDLVISPYSSSKQKIISRSA